MKISARLARLGGMLVLVAGTIAGLASTQAASATSALAREILSPAQRVATTGDPALFDGNDYGWASGNWSGYAVTGGPYTSATGAWTIPTVPATGGATFSDTWTGIDGFQSGNADLIQSGTEQDSSHGTTTYFPWWTTNEEGFSPQTTWTSLSCASPCDSTPAVFTVNPHDSMTVTITETDANVWEIVLDDTTTGVGGTETGISHTAFDGSSGGESAEWIIERPAFVNPRGAIHFSTLANYGTATFDTGTVNGDNPGLVASATTSDAGLMVQGSGSKVLSIPSVPDSDTDGFADSHGNIAPPRPY